MTNALVLVERTDGEKQNFPLVLEAVLREIRHKLSDRGFMSDDDAFLLHNAPIALQDEESVTLDQVVGKDGAAPLQIGQADGGLDPGDTSVDRYNRLNTSQRLALFNNLQIYNGLTASPEQGFTRTFKPCIANWHETQLPESVQPNFVTQVVVSSSFSEVEQSMAVSSVDKASASVDTPYGGGQSSFEYAQKHSKDSKKVNEYLTGKFLVNKVLLDVDVSNLQLVPDFEPQVLAAVKSGNEIDLYANLIGVLNERGYFAAKRFTLGGALLSTSSTTISEFSEADSEQTDFSVGFKAAVDGFGGGGDYSHSEGSEKSSSTKTKYSNLNITKRGGSAEAEEYADWAKSLNPAINWDVISYDELYPTLALISDKSLLRYCLKLLNTYNSYPTVQDKQSVISIAKYATQIESIFNTGGGSFG